MNKNKIYFPSEQFFQVNGKINLTEEQRDIGRGTSTWSTAADLELFTVSIFISSNLSSAKIQFRLLWWFYKIIKKLIQIICMSQNKIENFFLYNKTNLTYWQR